MNSILFALIAASMFLWLMAETPVAAADKPLKGKVEHARTSSSNVRSSSTKQDAFAPDTRPPQIKWFTVPDWLAGVWIRKEPIIVTSEEDLVTGRKSERPGASLAQFSGNETCGYQQDSKGRIWHCLLMPYERIYVGDGNTRIVSTVDDADVVENDGKRLIIRRRSTRVTYNASDSIKNTSRCEEFTTYTPQDSSHVKAESELKFFDKNGKGTLLQKTSTILTLESKFSPIDYWPHGEEIDLRPLFQEFLSEHSVNPKEIMTYGQKKNAPAKVNRGNHLQSKKK